MKMHGRIGAVESRNRRLERQNLNWMNMGSGGAPTGQSSNVNKAFRVIIFSGQALLRYGFIAI
jgi:hypothetical protein